MEAPLSRNFHLPLPDELYQALRLEAQRRRRPATALVREVLEQCLKRLHEEALHAEIAAYAAKHAATSTDLDSELEAAGVETLRAVPSTSKSSRRKRKR